MKKGFSLIEIMQTVVLLGIIAGLSISFFKKLNPNERLFEATKRELSVAIQEVNRRMCNDTMPVCQVGSGDAAPKIFIDATLGTTLCQRVYGNSSTYDETTGYCKNDDQETPKQIYCTFAPLSCVYDDNKVEGTEYPYTSAFPAMQKGNDNNWYAEVPCAPDNSGNIDSGTPITGNLFSDISLKPANEILCPNGIPDYASKRNGTETAFCYYMHEVLSHKMQGTTESVDLLNTCAVDNADSDVHPFTKARNGNSNNSDNENNISTFVTVTATAAKNSDTLKGNYNMLLPNGARLFNLGGSFPQNIYIKYDRIGDNDSAVYTVTGGNFDPKKSTIGVYRIVNPHAIAAGGGENVENGNDCINAGGKFTGCDCSNIEDEEDKATCEADKYTKNTCTATSGTWSGTCEAP